MGTETTNEWENRKLIALVEEFTQASDSYAKAAETWQADTTVEASAEALHKAERDFRLASEALAHRIASLVRTGDRLHLPKGNG